MGIVDVLRVADRHGVSLARELQQVGTGVLPASRESLSLSATKAFRIASDIDRRIAPFEGTGGGLAAAQAANRFAAAATDLGVFSRGVTDGAALTPDAANSLRGIADEVSLAAADARRSTNLIAQYDAEHAMQYAPDEVASETAAQAAPVANGVAPQHIASAPQAPARKTSAPRLAALILTPFVGITGLAYAYGKTHPSGGPQAPLHSSHR